MPKDLLQALRTVRGENDHVVQMHDMGFSQLEYGSGSPPYMAHFFEEVDQLRNSMDVISELVEQVKKMHSDILSSPHQDEAIKRQMEEDMEQIKRKANVVRMKLKEMEKGLQAEEKDGCNSANFRIRKTQHSTLSLRLVEVMTQYNNCQIEFRERCKDRIQRHLEYAERKITDDQLEDMLESGNPAIFTQEIMAETQQAQSSLRIIEARHEDIIKLEKSIKELSDMFMDMAMLVEGQGEMIDRIEYNVDQTVDHIREAKNQTNKAVKYQSRARRKKIICIIIVIVVLVIIAIIIGLAVGLNVKT